MDPNNKSVPKNDPLNAIIEAVILIVDKLNSTQLYFYEFSLNFIDCTENVT